MESLQKSLLAFAVRCLYGREKNPHQREITSLQQGLESLKKLLEIQEESDASRTEPKIRLLVEAIDERKAKEIFNILANIIQKTL